jgi:hypothetical protein
MIVQDALNGFGRWFGRTLGHTDEFKKVEEPSKPEIWNQVSPLLERGLSIYDRKESAATPDFTLNPLRDSKNSCRKDLEQILDKLLDVLGLCGAIEYRNRIRLLGANNASSRERIGNFRQQLLSAPAEKSLNAIEGIWTRSREGLQEQIDLEADAIANREQQIENSKLGFREHLKELGMDLSPQAADSFLLPIEDDIILMAAVISNIKQLTVELERLLSGRREELGDAMRYYGVYLLLVLALDRLEKQFIKKVDEEFLLRLKYLSADARQIIADARSQISKGGPQAILLANIETNNRTISGCELFAKVLESQRRTILDRNTETQRVFGAAVNTYRTVRIATDVRKVIGECQMAFKALRELSLPPLRTFQNIQLNEELQRLAERLAAKE